MKKQILLGLLVLTMLLSITACTDTGESLGTDADTVDKDVLVEETAEETKNEEIEGSDTVKETEATAETPADPEDEYPEDRLIVNKQSVTEGDPVFVTAYGGGRDWLCISRAGEKKALYWWYLGKVDGFINIRPGRKFDITTAVSNTGDETVLPPGDYVIYLIADDKRIEDNDYIEVAGFSIVKPAGSEDSDNGQISYGEPLTQVGIGDLSHYFDYWSDWYKDNNE